MKTHVLIVSTAFPKTHKRAGDQTGFVEKIRNREKLHTIRANYDLWKKRIDEVNSGVAMLSVRVWTGKPYQSKQKEVFQSIAERGICIQKLEDPDSDYATADGTSIDWEDVAQNDGLSFEDFREWFKDAGSEPMAIIHFTDFRY